MTQSVLEPSLSEELLRARSLIRAVPNFPKPGIVFRDITPMLGDPAALLAVVQALAKPWKGKADLVAGMESRGFIFGTLLARELDVGFVPVRKPGKLPYKRESVSYGLEYGTDTLEMHIDACSPEHRVLICDDLIATGGTAAATAQLVERVGAQVAGFSFAIELEDLRGRAQLKGHRIESLFRL